ncbi:MAG: acyl-CoA thioesterase [Bacteroidia bacterium]|nr:acyl-CoA thioesterase [Bacteroidia bacterium]
MGVVWHGNYLRFMEDAREAFGLKYGLTYLSMYHSGYFTPIVKSDIDYKSPLYYGDKAKVIATLVQSNAAKIIFEYEIKDLKTEKVCAVGKTVQIFLNAATRALELNKPGFYLEWENKLG